MAIIHKLVEPGAEAYLPFLLARERVIRRRRENNAEGAMSGGYAVKYELGDNIVGELRMVGNQSFIRLTVGKAAGVSVIYQRSSDTTWTDSNVVAIFDEPWTEPPPQPIRVVPPPGTPFTFTQEPPAWVDCGVGVPNWQNSWVGGTAAYNAAMAQASASYAGAALEYYKLTLGPNFKPEPGWLPAPSGVGAVGCATDPNEGFPRSIPGFVYAWSDGPFFDAWLAWYAISQAEAAAAEAIERANAAAQIAWQQDMRARSDALYAALISTYYSTARAQRGAQIAAVIAEQDKGLGSQIVSMTALRPGYVPQEVHKEPFFTSLGIPEASGALPQQVWPFSGPGSAQMGNVVSVADASALYGEQVGIDMTDVMVGQSLLVNDIGFDRFRTSGARGYGYLMSGRMAKTNLAAESDNVQCATAETYSDWYFSEREKTEDVKARNEGFAEPIKCDLIPPGQPGALYFAFFEFYAYDFKTDEWTWLPALFLQTSIPALMRAHEDGIVYEPSLNGHRETTYPNRPLLENSVTSIRTRKLMKQSVAMDGTVSAVEEVRVDPPITWDLASYPGTVRDDLGDFIVMVEGAPKWALPVSAKYVLAELVADEFVVPELRKGIAPTDIDSIPERGALTKSLFRTCLTRFNL